MMEPAATLINHSSSASDFQQSGQEQSGPSAFGESKATLLSSKPSWSQAICSRFPTQNDESVNVYAAICLGTFSVVLMSVLCATASAPSGGLGTTSSREQPCPSIPVLDVSPLWLEAGPNERYDSPPPIVCQASCASRHES